MRWSKYPALTGFDHYRHPAKDSHRSDDGLYRVQPGYGTGYDGKRLKQVVWKLYEGQRVIGRPFHSLRLAKAFAEALAALGEDRRARADFIKNGAEWCYAKENEWRQERDRRHFASFA